MAWRTPDEETWQRASRKSTRGPGDRPMPRASRSVGRLGCLLEGRERRTLERGVVGRLGDGRAPLMNVARDRLQGADVRRQIGARRVAIERHARVAEIDE